MIDIALDDNIFIYDEFSAAFQELDLLFNTECTEVLGATKYGLSLYQYLWMLTPAEDSLKNYIEGAINENTLYVKKFNYTVAVHFLTSDTSSMYLVTITLTNTAGTKKTRNYKFQ